MQYIKLEDEIDDIQEISVIRDELVTMLAYGTVELCKSFSSPPKSPWPPIETEPKDLLYPSMLRILATRRYNWYNSEEIKRANEDPSSTPTQHLLSASDQLFDQLNNLDTKDLGKAILKGRGGSYNSPAPIFQSARLLQASVSGEKNLPLKGFFCAYYSIIKELSEVTQPAWSMGSARARSGAPQTAFMTGECAKALNSVARALDSTANQARLISEAFNAICNMIRNSNLSPLWIQSESKRLLLDISAINFWEQKRAITGIIPREVLHALYEIITPLPAPNKGAYISVEKIRDFVFIFMTQIKNLGIEVRKLFTFESQSIDEYHNYYTKKLQLDYNAAKRDNDHKRKQAIGNLRIANRITHDISKRATDESKKYISGLELLANELEDWLNKNKNPSNANNLGIIPEIFSSACSNFADLCTRLSDAVRGNLAASKTFLESILDRELAAEKAERVNPTELVFAAAALIELEPNLKDDRLAQTIEIASRWITGDGLLDSYSYLDTNSDGYCLVLLGSEVLRSLSQILEKVKDSMSVSLCKRIASYFHRMAVVEEGSKKIVGWRHDFPRTPGEPQRWTTVAALLSLEFVTRSLNAQLNHRISRHFTTSSPKRGATRLDQLRYSDFGLMHEDLFQANPEAKGESVAFFMQRMRAHLQGMPPNDFIESYEDECYSLILFGPPGTGKTSLIDALSTSSDCPKVEVTPSDILQEGESFVERRAKLVFRALSMLTNSVILFDEFDSLLKRRTDTSIQSVYSFLTPGLLPKLTELYKSSSKRRNAYALATNRVGTLDDAAIRKERFDYRVGVYPLDAVSHFNAICVLYYSHKTKTMSVEIKERLQANRSRLDQIREYRKKISELNRDVGKVEMKAAAQIADLIANLVLPTSGQLPNSPVEIFNKIKDVVASPTRFLKKDIESMLIKIKNEFGSLKSHIKECEAEIEKIELEIQNSERENGALLDNIINVSNDLRGKRALCLDAVNRNRGVGIVRLVGKGDLTRWSGNPVVGSIQYFLENGTHQCTKYVPDDNPDQMYTTIPPDSTGNHTEPPIRLAEEKQWRYSCETLT